MTDKLVERLRERASAVESPMMSAVREQIEWEAADTIEGLEAEVKRLNEIEDRLGEAALGLERKLAEARAEIERKDKALRTAKTRFELIAAGNSEQTASPAIGAKECSEALADHQNDTTSK